MLALLALLQGPVVVPTVETGHWYLALLVPLVPVISGFLSVKLADGLKQVFPWYDNASSTIKLLISLAVGALVGFANSHLALTTPLGTDIHGWTADVLNAVLSALAMSGIYRLDKNKQLAMQGAARLEARAKAVNPNA